MNACTNTAWFVTGTDTEIGKTFITAALLHAFRLQGKTAIGMKPIAAGLDAAGLNEDVEQLRDASSLALPRQLINPYSFPPPIAPHIAAEETGVSIDFQTIHKHFQALQQEANVVLVEGVGGYLVPLGPTQDSADLAVALGLPVIMVVGMRLGCINHALLTAASIRASGLPLAGWVANRVAPEMSHFEANLAALKQRLEAPLLGVVPHLQGPTRLQDAAACLALPA